MAIKIKPRTFIDPNFIDMYRYVAKEKLRNLHSTLLSYSRQGQLHWLKKNRHVIGRLNALLSEEMTAGKGMDFEITRMRSMAYTKLDIHKDRYFVGHTADVVMEEVDGRNKVIATWDTGPYTVYIPVQALISGSMNSIHFIPERNPDSTGRHPHHVCYQRGETHYLDYSPSTCWATFATPVGLAMREVNLPDLFRLLRIFVGKYYNGSPLNTECLRTFMRRLP